MIEFAGWSVYTDAAEPFRRWKLSTGAPEIGIEGAMEVVEDAHRGKRRFILQDPETKEYGKDLEEWDLRLLFRGDPPAWGPVGPFLAHLLEIDPESAREIRGLALGLAKIEKASDIYTFPETPVEGAPAREGSEWALRSLGLEDGPHHGLYALRVPIPAIDARPGDVLAMESGRGDRRVSDVRGHVRQIDRSQYKAVAEVVEAAGSVVPLFERYGRADRLSGCLRKSAIHASRAKPESAPLYVLRPYSSPVSEPIEAPSDTHAMFELLQQVGEADHG